jgi:hypothetical protein
MAEFAMRKHRDRFERRAAPHPAEKHPHLQLAHVELKIARKSPMALFGRERDNVQIEAFRLDGSVDQKARPIIFVARQSET